METNKAAQDGKITDLRLADGDIRVTWYPLGGSLGDRLEFSILAVKREGKGWVIRD